MTAGNSFCSQPALRGDGRQVLFVLESGGPEDGTVTFRPEEFYRQFFHDDLSEGDSATQQVFRAVVAKLEAEFTVETPHP